MRSDAKSDMKEAHAHFQETRTVDGNTCPLADNLGGEDEVLKDLLVDAREGAATGPLLLHPRSTGGLAQHPSLGNENDMAVRELLLELTGQPACKSAFGTFASSARYTPLLDLVEGLQLGDGDKDDDGLLATADIHLAGSRDLEWAELSLELGCAVLEVDDRLGDGDLSLICGSPGRVGRAEDLVLNGHLVVLRILVDGT